MLPLRNGLSQLATGCALIALALLLVAWSPARAHAEPVTLVEVLARASASSPVLVAAQADVSAAEGRAQQAGLRPNPELDFSAENVGGSGDFSGLQGAETTLSIGQRVELGGKRTSRRDVAEAEVRLARLRFRETQADIEQGVRIAYAEAWAAGRRLDLARDQFLRAENLQEIATTLVEAGREPPLRAIRARSVALEAVGKVRAAEADYEAAQRALAALWGGTGELPEPVSLDEPPMVVAIDPSDALDVVIAEAEVAVSVAVVARERNAATPDLTVSVGARHLAGSDDTALVFGASMPIGLFDRNQGNIAAANAERTGAEARRNAALAAWIRQDRDARASLRTAEARLTFLESRAEPESVEAVRIAREGFAAGRFTLLDVLDAEEALNTVQTEIIAAQLDHARALAGLIRATTLGATQ